MNTKKLSSEPNGTIQKFVGIDSNGNVVLETITIPSAFNGIQIVASLISANLNSLSDQAFAFISGTDFIVTDIAITNLSKVLNSASDGEIWTGVGQTGNRIMLTDYGNGSDALTQMDHGTGIASMSNGMLNFSYLVNTPGGTYPKPRNIPQYRISNKAYFSLAIAEGSAATADIYIFGFKMA